MTIREQLTPALLIQLHVRDNLSLSEIGVRYGISRQRVHQLKKEYEQQYGKITRRVVIDVLTLKHYLEQGWTAKRIAEHFEMNPSKVNRMIRKYKDAYEEGASPVQITRKKTTDIISQKELFHLYVEELYTDRQIADMYQMSPSSVNLLRRKYHIPTLRTKSLRQLPVQLPKSTFERLYLREGYTLKEIAAKYQCNVVSIIRLKEHYEIKK